MNQKEDTEKLLDAILTARAAAEEAGGLGLCLSGVLDIVEVSFRYDLCKELLGVVIAYGRKKAQEDAGNLSPFKGKADRAIQIAEELNRGDSINVDEISKESIPRDRGLYIFRTRDGWKPVYVGVALGKEGLRQRIEGQHLSEAYRKSVLRIKIAKEMGFSTEKDCIRFMQDNFTLAYFPCPGDEPVTVKLAELLLISFHQPKYNHESHLGGNGK